MVSVNGKVGCVLLDVEDVYVVKKSYNYEVVIYMMDGFMSFFDK